MPKKYSIYEVIFSFKTGEGVGDNRTVTIVSDDYKRVLAIIPSIRKENETFERIDKEDLEEVIILDD